MTDTSHRRFLLAVDAGGSKADFLLADDHSELARVQVGSIKTLTTSVAAAESNFFSALQRLQQLSGIAPAQIARTCIGTSGFSIPSVAQWLREQHRRYAAGDLLLCGDEEIALDAAFRDGRGVLVLAGTGSNVVGRTREGTLTTAGGWGPAIGDEGSGHWIGLEAVRALFRAADEDRSTTLEQAVMEAWELESRQELVERANQVPLQSFAALTPIVARCAETGDQVADETLAAAGRHLARQAEVVIRRMQRMEGHSFQLPQVAIAGSILGKLARVRDAMFAGLQRHWPEILVHSQAVDPVLGALWRARSPQTLAKN